jgi:WhiB family transcriptional regulator, redox-sensing transcriptional regulator
MTVTHETDWRDGAACVAADPDLFFPISSGGISRVQERRAKAFCAICHVRPQCLAFAIETQQLYGIWGGLSEKERTRLMRRRRLADGRAPRERAARLRRR